MTHRHHHQRLGRVASDLSHLSSRTDTASMRSAVRGPTIRSVAVEVPLTGGRSGRKVVSDGLQRYRRK